MSYHWVNRSLVEIIVDHHATHKSVMAIDGVSLCILQNLFFPMQKHHRNDLPLNIKIVILCCLIKRQIRHLVKKLSKLKQGLKAKRSEVFDHMKFFADNANSLPLSGFHHNVLESWSIEYDQLVNLRNMADRQSYMYLLIDFQTLHKRSENTLVSLTFTIYFR